MNMLEPPTALFKPNIVLNVFSESLAAQPATEQSDASSELKPMNR
jgi:hypothetical protein